MLNDLITRHLKKKKRKEKRNSHQHSVISQEKSGYSDVGGLIILKKMEHGNRCLHPECRERPGRIRLSRRGGESRQTVPWGSGGGEETSEEVRRRGRGEERRREESRTEERRNVKM